MVKRGLILGGVISLLWSFSAFAEGADFSIDVGAASLQLTVPQNIDIELQPTSSAAVFDSRLLTFNVATNNPTGYRVLMSVPQTEMLHSSIVTANIPTLSATSTEANFPANKWGYKTTGDYFPVKLSNENAAWNNDNPTNGTDHSLTLAAKVDGSQVAGLYTNTLTFTVVVNPNAPKDTIVFNSNNANATGTTSSQTVFRGEPTTLNPNGYSVEGYSFKGWSTRADGLGTGYGDEDIYTDSLSFDTPTSTITLYAQWEAGGSGGYSGKTLQAAFEEAYVNNPGQFPKDEGGYKHGLYVPHKTDGVYDGTYFEATKQSDYDGIPANDLRFAIQHINMLVDGQTVCERATVIGSEVYVLDLRDNKSYWIAKLVDGKCWMTQNLALDLNSNTSLTHEYSDIGWGTDPSTSWTPPASANTTSISGTWVNWPLNATSDLSASTGVMYRTPSGASDVLHSSSASCQATMKVDARVCEHFRIGNFYSWSTANADANVNNLEPNGSAQNSICPSGWKIPSATAVKYAVSGGYSSYATGDWYDMVDKQGIFPDHNYGTYLNYGAWAILNAPVYLVRGGNTFNYKWYQSDSGNTSGTYVGSSRYESNTDPSKFGFTVRAIGTNYTGPYGYGMNVRCLAR